MHIRKSRCTHSHMFYSRKLPALIKVSRLLVSFLIPFIGKASAFFWQCKWGKEICPGKLVCSMQRKSTL